MRRKLICFLLTCPENQSGGVFHGHTIKGPISIKRPHMSLLSSLYNLVILQRSRETHENVLPQLIHCAKPHHKLRKPQVISPFVKN